MDLRNLIALNLESLTRGSSEERGRFGIAHDIDHPSADLRIHSTTLN